MGGMSTDDETPVRTETQDGVLVVTLDRPRARNAIDGATARALAAALDRLDAEDDLRVGVLTGAGGTFCSGMDLKAFLTGDVPFVEGRGSRSARQGRDCGSFPTLGLPMAFRFSPVIRCHEKGIARVCPAFLEVAPVPV